MNVNNTNECFTNLQGSMFGHRFFDWLAGLVPSFLLYCVTLYTGNCRWSNSPENPVGDSLLATHNISSTCSLIWYSSTLVTNNGCKWRWYNT